VRAADRDAVELLMVALDATCGTDCIDAMQSVTKASSTP
jgi:hypothetical protein